MKTTITLDRLHDALDYDPTTGIFRWQYIRDPQSTADRTHNKVRAGRMAGTRLPDGTIRITVDGEPYLAHRLAWLMAYRSWPKWLLHIDGDRGNNRLDNLMEKFTQGVA